MGLFGGSDSDDSEGKEKADRNVGKLIKEAEGATVTKDILTKVSPKSLNKIERVAHNDIFEKDYFVEKNPIIHYLPESENPQFIFHAKVSPSSNGEIFTCNAKKDGEDIFDYQYDSEGGLVLCFTNKSILFIRDDIPPEKTGFFSKSQPDYTIDVSYTDVEKFDFEWPEDNMNQIGNKNTNLQFIIYTWN